VSLSSFLFSLLRSSSVLVKQGQSKVSFRAIRSFASLLGELKKFWLGTQMMQMNK
jgi:hypothetical protein